VEFLRQRSRPYLFSNTVAPTIVSGSIAAIELLEADTTLIDTLRENTAFFRSSMVEAGFSIPEGDHPIVPIMLNDAGLATRMATRLLEKGIYVIGFSYPVVPKGAARIRVQVSAAHSREELAIAVERFAEVRRELGTEVSR
jgi:glycine C-acetyltransferase